MRNIRWNSQQMEIICEFNLGLSYDKLVGLLNADGLHHTKYMKEIADLRAINK